MENYQYAECKHCGKSVMEGEIHSCKQMLLAEIDQLRVENTVLRQQKDEAWTTTGLMSEQKRNDLLFTDSYIVTGKQIGRASCRERV